MSREKIVPAGKAGTTFLLLLFCEDKVPGNQEIDKVDDAQNPGPSHEKEQEEHDDVYDTLCPEHDGQTHEAFHDPPDDGQNEKNKFQKPRLFVEPLIESHEKNLLRNLMTPL